MLLHVRWILLSLGLGPVGPLHAETLPTQTIPSVGIEIPTLLQAPQTLPPSLSPTLWPTPATPSPTSTPAAPATPAPAPAPSPESITPPEVETPSSEVAPDSNPDAAANPDAASSEEVVKPDSTDTDPSDSDDANDDDEETEAVSPESAFLTPLAKAFSFLKAEPQKRYAIALMRSHSRHQHISLLWYETTADGSVVPRMFDGTRYGIRYNASLALSRVTSLFYPIDPKDNAALRAAVRTKARRPNPRGTCLASVIGPSRESLLMIAKRYFGAQLGAGTSKNPGEVFVHSGMPVRSAWHFELFALKRPELLRKMGFELLATGPLLPPTLSYAPELGEFRNLLGNPLLSIEN